MREASVLVALCLLAPSAFGAAKDKKTMTVGLRALPRVAAAPVSVTFNVDLAGGVDAQPCPTLEWEWGDGTRFEQEDACEAPEPGEPARADAAQHFTASHEYRRAARPKVTLTVRQEGRILGHASIALIIGEPKQPLSGSVRQIH
jgi:hypothetical protein